MPKSTGPLLEQLGLGTANQSTPNTTKPTTSDTDSNANMSDSTTSAADKIGANKGTNAIPQENPSVLSSAGAIGKNCTLPCHYPHIYMFRGSSADNVCLNSQPRWCGRTDW